MAVLGSRLDLTLTEFAAMAKEGVIWPLGGRRR